MLVPKNILNLLLKNTELFLNRRFMLNTFAVSFDLEHIAITKEEMVNLIVAGWMELSGDMNLSEYKRMQVVKVVDTKNLRTNEWRTLTGILEFRNNKWFLHSFGQHTRGTESSFGTKKTFSPGRKPLDVIDTFILEPGMISNYPKNKEPFETTVGKFIVNQVLLADPFVSAIPYQDSMKDVLKSETIIAEGLLNGQFTVDQYNKYINNLYLMQSFAELVVPTGTAKSFTTDPKIKERKLQLLKKYAGQLHDPLVAKKMEDELLAMDREFIKGDTSERFIDALGSKGRNIHRKKLFLTVGGIEDFSDTPGNYTFIQNSLSDGWDPKDFPTIVNEIRKGSYNRGKETELGGMQTKLAMRIFSDLRLTQDNCMSTDCVELKLTEDMFKAFLYRYILDKGELVLLTPENINKYVGKTVQLRSPMLCKTADGLCYTCCGKAFRDVSVRGISMLIVDITSTFTLFSMKNMHGTEISTLDLSRIFPEFIIVS